MNIIGAIYTLINRAIDNDLGYGEMNLYFVYIYFIEKLISLLILSFLEEYVSPKFLQ